MARGLRARPSSASVQTMRQHSQAFHWLGCPADTRPQPRVFGVPIRQPLPTTRLATVHRPSVRPWSAGAGRHRRPPDHRLSVATIRLGSGDAEVAFVVQDGYQGHGIGTELFTLLARIGWDDGVRRFVADTFADNHAMLDVFLHTPGAVTLMRTRRDGNVVHLTMAVTAPGRRSPGSETTSDRSRGADARCDGRASPSVPGCWDDRHQPCERTVRAGLGGAVEPRTICPCSAQRQDPSARA